MQKLFAPVCVHVHIHKSKNLPDSGKIFGFMDVHAHMLEQIISAFKSPVRTLFYPCSCCPRPKKPQCRTYPDCWQRRQRQCVPCLRAQSDEARRIFPRTSSFLPLPCNSHATHMQHTCNTHATRHATRALFLRILNESARFDAWRPNSSFKVVIPNFLMRGAFSLRILRKSARVACRVACVLHVCCM